jgi:hypothetical protein
MSTALETTIADIWREILCLEAVGPDENFFDLGGNSLLMIRFHQRLQAVLGTTIPVVRLFERPTVRSLAASLRSEEPTARSHQQLLRSAASSPFRASGGGPQPDAIAERARKQRSARADVRARATEQGC